jgi:hypothetical protein
VLQVGGTAVGHVVKLSIGGVRLTEGSTDPKEQTPEPRLRQITQTEVGAFYWTVLAPDIVNSGREEQGSVSL